MKTMRRDEPLNYNKTVFHQIFTKIMNCFDYDL